MVSIFVDPIDKTVYKAMNPLGEVELELARKNRERLDWYDKQYTIAEVKGKSMFKSRRYKGNYKRK